MIRPYRSGPIIPALLLAAAWVLAAAPSVSAGIDVPLFRSYFGIRMADTPGVGVTVAEVFANSPAAGAGIQAGDRIVSVEGKPVAKLTEVADLVTSHPPYDTVELVLDRQGTRLTRKVVLSGRMRFDAGPLSKVFPVPGIDTADEPVTPDAVAALDQINTLKRVIMDVKTGAVELIGSYDPRFATGPLPYREYLDEAIRHPEPLFSLDQTPEYFEAFVRLLAKKKADFDRLFGSNLGANAFYDWVRNWLALLNGHPLLDTDRRIYLGRLAAVAGLTGAELASLMNYDYLAGAQTPVPPDILAVQDKLLRNLGFEKEAELYALYRAGTEEALREAAKGLGKETQARDFLASTPAAGQTDGSKLARLKAFVCAALIDALNPRAARQAPLYLRQYDSGKMSMDSLDTTLQWKIFPEYDRAGRALVFEALNGMPLSNEMVRIFYGDAPGPASLRYKNISPQSALAQVLYEADYLAKTIDQSQQIFRTIPGHKTFQEIDTGRPVGRSVNYIMTFVPREVPMFISDGKDEITFGESRVFLDLAVEKVPGEEDLGPEDTAAAMAKGTAYTRQINDGYDAYAREYPALHKLREAAKAIALGKWLAEQRISVRTGASTAPAWDPPARVPALMKTSMKFSLVKDTDGKLSYDFRMPLWVVGGVDFGVRKNWVVLGPKPPSYVPVSDQLTTSAALGEQAVQAALGGNLESARELAELSARALTGDLDASRLPKNVPLPKAASGRAAKPEEVRLVKEAVKAIRATAAEPSAGPAATSAADRSAYLSQVGEALRTVRSDPASASSLLTRLQTRAFSPKAPGGGPIPPAGDANTGGAPAPFDCAAYMSRFAAGADLGEGRKAFLDGKIREIQGRLETVRKAMDELGRLRQGDLQALEKWQGEISRAYEDAQARALDAVAMLLVDGPLEILQKRRDALKDAIDYGLATTLLTRNAVLSADVMAGLDRTAFSLFRMKYLFEGIYGRAERLQKTLTGAKSLYDMTQWADSDQTDLEKIKAGTSQLVEMVLNEPALGGAIRIGKLTGDTILRFLSLYKATDAAFGFFYDLMKLKFAWGPVVDELQRSIETNLRAVRTLQERSRDLQNQLNCVRASMK